VQSDNYQNYIQQKPSITSTTHTPRSYDVYIVNEDLMDKHFGRHFCTFTVTVINIVLYGAAEAL